MYPDQATLNNDYLDWQPPAQPEMEAAWNLPSYESQWYKGPYEFDQLQYIPQKLRQSGEQHHTGQGWNFGSHDAPRSSGVYLPGGRQYKTKWVAPNWGGKLTGMGYHRMYEGNTHWNQFASANPEWKSDAVRGRLITGRTAQGIGVGSGHRGAPNAFVEQLDWDAYDVDPQYKAYLDAQGKRRYRSLDEIHEAEKWFLGATDRREQNTLNELRAQLAREQTQREEFRRMWEAQQPKILNIKGTEVPITGIGDYIAQQDSATANRFSEMQSKAEASYGKLEDQMRAQGELFQDQLASASSFGSSPGPNPNYGWGVEGNISGGRRSSGGTGQFTRRGRRSSDTIKVDNLNVT